MSRRFFLSLSFLTTLCASAEDMPFNNTSPAAATKEHPFVNTLGMQFVPVPGTKVLFCIQWQSWKG